MDTTRTSVLSNGLLWFGAAISIAEILTGTLLAPLGFGKGIGAILLGHVIGCIPLYLAGLIGAKKGTTAMESVRISFGRKGTLLFSVLNVLQLVGWTAVMIISTSKAISVIADPSLHIQGGLIWCALTGALIILWLAIGLKNLGKVNIFAVGALFALTVVLSTVVFKGAPAAGTGTGISFGGAVELSAAMPLSWLPLIADYTKEAKKPRAVTIASVAAYFAGSCWMFIIGLGAAVFLGNSDIAQVMMAAGLGVVGVLVVLLSSVTTTFLDAYSAGVSMTSITEKFRTKPLAIAVCVAGTLIAMFTPIEEYENFLYLIGSVFAPMTAILITDCFILKNDSSSRAANVMNLILWTAGFVIYRLFLSIDTVLGTTLPVMAITCLLCILVNAGKKRLLPKRGAEK